MTATTLGKLCVQNLIWAAAISTTSSVLAVTPNPVIVVTGGFDSCTGNGNGGISAFGSNFTAKGVEMVNELHAHFSTPEINWGPMTEPGIRWIFSCFNRVGDLYLQSDLDAEIQMTSASDLSPMITRIEQLSNNYTRPIYVIGHSHGGWLAMQIVESLRQPIKNGYLATLDPISFPECNPLTYADAVARIGFEGPWSGWEATAPCRQAPGDFSAGDISRISENLPARSWRHYYQTHFFPLHSADIPGGPSSSLDMSSYFSLLWGGAASSWSAHTRISYLSSIWFGLKESILRSYRENP